MDHHFQIDGNRATTKVQQIVNAVQKDLLSGEIPLHQKLPSITSFSKSLGVARETVEKAYNALKTLGLVTSVPGKGVYTASILPRHGKVLMLLNKMSSYKKEIHDSFITRLGKNFIVDIQIYHYDPEVFAKIMERTRGKYHFYVVMPHFFSGIPEESYLPIIESISPHQLLILDKRISLKHECRCVYQDFENDINDALSSNATYLAKYDEVKIIFPQQSHHPPEIINGISRFANQYGKKFAIATDLEEIALDKGQLYITLTESELARLIRMIRQTDLRIGIEIGIISFNETALKELLDISVITTDFHKMGLCAAELLLSDKTELVRTSYHFIKRASI